MSIRAKAIYSPGIGFPSTKYDLTTMFANDNEIIILRRKVTLVIVVSLYNLCNSLTSGRKPEPARAALEWDLAPYRPLTCEYNTLHKILTTLF